MYYQPPLASTVLTGLPPERKLVNIVGIPKELKREERRVAVTPDGVEILAGCGIQVLVEEGAGLGAGFSDGKYKTAGATILKSNADVWNRANLVVKVKEPVPSEYQFFREDLTLFTFLHLAANPVLEETLAASKMCAIGYETVTAEDGSLPLLSPMSEIAGKMASQIGAHYLEVQNGGKGVMMGGAAGVLPAKVAVVGCGSVGWNAAKIAAGMGAEVLLFDKNIERLRWVEENRAGKMFTVASSTASLERHMGQIDLLIGAVLIPNGKAPTVISEDMVQSMSAGSVIVDVAIDQGGCVETSTETSHSNPVFRKHDVLHYCVTNIPSAVPVTATLALTNATFPHVMALATERQSTLEYQMLPAK